MLCATLLASPALSEQDPCARSTSSETKANASHDGKPCEEPWAFTARELGSGDGIKPSSIHPIRGVHGTVVPLKRLGLWFQGQSLHLSGRSAHYDVEGGAALNLDDHVRFTASYRMSGIDLFEKETPAGSHLEPSLQAPFVGLAFDF